MSWGPRRCEHRLALRTSARLLTAAIVCSASACGNSSSPSANASGAPGAGTSATSLGGSNGLGGATAGTPAISAGASGMLATGGAANVSGGSSGQAGGGGNPHTGGNPGSGGSSGGPGSGGLGGSSGSPTAGSPNAGSGPTGGRDGGGSGSGSSGAPTGGSTGALPPFILGADITITMEDEYWDANYTDAGQQKSVEQILKDHGFNFIRIDTFVNPGAPGGFAADMEQPFRDLEHTITLARRVKAIDLGFLLDLHYSDTWTNPSAQAKPAAWAALSLAELETQVHDYTKDAVTRLKAAGATPDIVQVGNEITSGMLWDTGKASGSNFTNFATLLKAGIRAVHEVDPAIKIMLHIEKCNNTETSEWWLDGVLGAGVSFDIFGQSCYATAPNGVTGYQGTPAQWRTTFAALAARYPSLKFVIAEYSAEQRAANDTMFDLPDHRGLGTFNWDPTRSYETHPNYPLFSTNGAWNRYVAIPELMALYEKMAADYGLR